MSGRVSLGVTEAIKTLIAEKSAIYDRAAGFIEDADATREALSDRGHSYHHDSGPYVTPEMLRSAQALADARKRKAARDKALAARKARRANR